MQQMIEVIKEKISQVSNPEKKKHERGKTQVCNIVIYNVLSFTNN